MQSVLRPRVLLALLLLLAPSALYLFWHADIPEFGRYHDDSLYFVAAKSLANGEGYRIESLPGEPSQTKYPPLYPLLLSLAWRLNPHFPENLPIAAWLSWLALPAILIQLAVYYPKLGISHGRAWLLLVLLAINPYVIWYSSQLMSELPFMALMVSAMLLVEWAAAKNSKPVAAAAAGVVAGLAYLTRSAGIVMLLTAPLYLVLCRARRQAWYFAGAMLPFVAAWMGWVHFHQLKTADPALIYYTNYAEGWRQNIALGNLHLHLWKNFDGLLWGLGSLIIPKSDSWLVTVISQVLAVAMIAGVVRIVRRGQGIHYALFAAGNALLLLVWHFPPDERIVLPLFPLALAGLTVELENFVGMVRRDFHRGDAAQRSVAMIMMSVVVVVLGGALALQAYAASVVIPARSRKEREHNAEAAAVYSWIRTNLPANSSVFASEDPLLFLYTGRHAISQPIPPLLHWYLDDHAGEIGLFRSLAAYAREHGLTYIYFKHFDRGLDVSDEDRAAIENAVQSDPDFIPVFSEGDATIYRVRTGSSQRAATSRTLPQ